MGVATLGSVFGNYRLNPTCNDCGRSKELDVGQLMEKYRKDFEIPRLIKMAKCTVCGSPNGCAVQLGNLNIVKMGQTSGPLGLGAFSSALSWQV